MEQKSRQGVTQGKKQPNLDMKQIICHLFFLLLLQPSHNFQLSHYRIRTQSFQRNVVRKGHKRKGHKRIDANILRSQFDNNGEKTDNNDNVTTTNEGKIKRLNQRSTLDLIEALKKWNFGPSRVGSQVNPPPNIPLNVVTPSSTPTSTPSSTPSKQRISAFSNLVNVDELLLGNPGEGKENEEEGGTGFQDKNNDDELVSAISGFDSTLPAGLKKVKLLNLEVREKGQLSKSDTAHTNATPLVAIVERPGFRDLERLRIFLDPP